MVRIPLESYIKVFKRGEGIIDGSESCVVNGGDNGRDNGGDIGVIMGDIMGEIMDYQRFLRRYLRRSSHMRSIGTSTLLVCII